MNTDTIYYHAVVVCGIATAGAIVGVFFRRVHHLFFCLLVSLAAGALVGVACFQMIPHHLEEAGGWLVYPGVGLGVLGFLQVSRWVHICPACSAGHFEGMAGKAKSVFNLVLIVLAIHGFMDGTSLAAGPESYMGVALHKFPEGLATGMLAMKMFDEDRFTALVISCSVQGFTLMGASFGHVYPSMSWLHNSVCQGVIAGGFLFLGLHALRGEITRNCRWYVVLLFVIGLVLAATVGGHAHD